MKILFLAIFILASIVVVAQVVISKSTANTDTIKYETITKFDGFEIRKYPEFTIATTYLTNGSYKEKSRVGFQRIASYIFGGNSDNTQISMTSPVKMEMTASPSMSFYMPDEMSLNGLPEPNRKDVNIMIEPAKTVAVIQFSGWVSDKLLEEKFEELKTKLIKRNIEFEDSYSYLGYNPPYQLINRKNEVVINLKNYPINN